MLHLITGGSGSGKSAYAERMAMAADGPDREKTRRIYIATMIPRGEEGRRRVRRHRQMRKEKCFETVECPVHLAQLEIPPGSTVLLECMSNLVANEFFEPEGAHAHTVREVLAGVRRLREQAGSLFIVTNEIFSDGVDYGAETMRYLACLGEVNCALADAADVVTEVVYGIPVTVKPAGQIEVWG